jgi:NitT/TauT family transport system substrate-binding protein
MRCAVVAWALLTALAACGAPASQSGSGAAARPAGVSAAATSAAPAPAPAASVPLKRLKIGSATPSLSYLPAQVALKRGFFEEEGLAAEFVQVNGNAFIPALLSGEIDLTTNLSSIGAHAGQGGESKIVQFHAVKLQHVLVVRPDITDVQQLSGKRIAAGTPGTLPAFEAKKLIERYGLRDVTVINTSPAGGGLPVVEAGAADATVASVPENLVAERQGYPTLLRMGTILDVPQAGLGTTDAVLRDQPDLVQRALRASARALPLVRSQREEVTRMIADWIELPPEDAARAYELVQDTYSPNGLPTDTQMRAYLGLLQETANVPADAAVDRISDFTLASRVAAELGLPSQ